jgi:hypothetical protein
MLYFNKSAISAVGALRSIGQQRIGYQSFGLERGIIDAPVLKPLVRE